MTSYWMEWVLVARYRNLLHDSIPIKYNPIGPLHAVHVSVSSLTIVNKMRMKLFAIIKFDGLVQERRNSIANALGLRFAYSTPSIW